MHLSLLAAAAGYVLFGTMAGAVPTPELEERASVPCFDGPYIIYAAGTKGYTDLSPPYPVVVEPGLVDIARDAFPGGTIRAVPYPAAGRTDPSQYDTSWFEGTQVLQGMIRDYVSSCPGRHIVLMGYSQGASVVTSAIGGYYRAGRHIDPLGPNALNAIVGGAVFADPSFRVGITPLDGSGVLAPDGPKDPNTSVNGAFQNGDSQAITNNVKGNVIRSYCQSGDRYCSNNPNDNGRHANAINYWRGTATNFLRTLRV